MPFSKKNNVKTINLLLLHARNGDEESDEEEVGGRNLWGRTNRCGHNEANTYTEIILLNVDKEHVKTVTITIDRQWKTYINIMA